MPFIAPVDPDQAGADVKAMYDADIEAQGYVANYTRAFSLRPEVFAGWKALNVSIKSRMDLRLYELATVAAASAIRSSYCSLVHGGILADRFSSAEEVVTIARDPAVAGLNPADTAVVHFARKVALAADTVTQRDVDQLRGLGFSDTEVFDIAAAAAARCFFSKLLDAVGTRPDAKLNEMPEELRVALAVGRPIEPDA